MNEYAQFQAAKALVTFAAGGAYALFSFNKWAKNKLDIEENLYDHILEMNLIRESQRKMQELYANYAPKTDSGDPETSMGEFVRSMAGASSPEPKAEEKAPEDTPKAAPYEGSAYL